MREENLELLRRLVQAPLPPLSAPEPGSPRVIPEESRSGLPTARVVAERSRYLHSRYDPRREAQRLAASREGYLVLLGFGLGYLAAALGELPGVTGVLAVEPAPQVASLLREGVSLDHLCEVSPKVRLRFLEEPRRLGEELFSFYLPMLDGRITLLIAEGYEELVDLAPFRDAFNDGVARLAGNYRTMARLGRGWTMNIIRNCRRLAEGASDRFGLAAPPARPAGRLILAGAGPSLATFLGEADSRGWPSHGPGEGETLLLAADTALPILRSHGIRADLVLSIDAQSATYLHYLPAPGPQPRMILADLTAPVSLAGESLPLALFAGGHPLGAMLLRREEGVLPLSTEGGNVGYTLLSAADALGGREVSCYGLDYAYLSGAPYARGSYLDSYFLTRTDRVEPLCSLWTQLLWRDPEARRIEDAPPWSYTDPRLDRFRERF
ncbi:MAG: 6-hydroxymethylpterin diphosphokinase MptE-like protein, partial [Alkalispirochaetaceae bacterium]